MADKLRQEASDAYVDDEFATAIDLYTQVPLANSFDPPRDRCWEAIFISAHHEAGLLGGSRCSSTNWCTCLRSYCSSPYCVSWSA